MPSMKKRLEVLEKAAAEAAESRIPDSALIIYDAALPLPPRPPGVPVVMYLPDNGRSDGPVIGVHYSYHNKSRKRWRG